MAEQPIKKKIIQIEAAPPGWFVLYLGYGGDKPDPNEYCSEKLDGYFVVPMAGWAVWEHPETGERGISPFMAEGHLADENDNFAKIVFRPDWLNVRLNGAETIRESSPFGISKNRLEVEIRELIVNEK